MRLVLTLKRRQYSDQEKQGMSTGKKVALGLGATAATAGAAFLGARKGMFGKTMQNNALMMQGKAAAGMNKLAGKIQNKTVDVAKNAEAGLRQNGAIPGATPNTPALISR